MSENKMPAEIQSTFFGDDNSVTFYGICEVLDLVCPDWENKPFNEKVHRDQDKKVIEFAIENSCYLYSAPREHFSFLVAQKETLKAGQKRCIVEDLS